MIRSARLLLRPWRESDLAPFHDMGQDEEVMAHFPALPTREDVAAAYARQCARLAEDGFCMWAAELPGIAPFIGFIGLQRVGFDAHFTPAVEVGWRLARPYWGQGLAREGARAAIAHGAGLGLREVVAMIVPANHRSRATAEGLGMTADSADAFDHPRLPDGHRLQRHMLYRLALGPRGA